MVLHTSPYPSAFLCFLSNFSWALVFPCYWMLDRLLSSCVATSLEKRRRSQDPCSFLALGMLISTPLYLVLLLASLPFALLGFLVWAPLQASRNPYIYSHRKPDVHRVEQGGGAGPGEWRPQGRSFCFGSANVCLLPDSLARFNNLADTQRRAREVGKRIRNGASRPQIKIYIDSPTNTSVSAASFCSLAAQGFRRTSSVDQRPEPSAGSEADTDPVGECPAHPSGGMSADCPMHSDQSIPECPLHPNGEEPAADCPVHRPTDPQVSAECPVHSTAAPSSDDCPLHPSGVQISITSPEPEPDDSEGRNHCPGDGDTGSLHSRAPSRESLTRPHSASGADAVISSNNTLSQHRTSVFKRTAGRKRRHGDDGFDHEISAFFPANLDFLCLQEVFDQRASERLCGQLHRYFPYVLSDVGDCGWRACCSPFRFLNSGLLLASRYPILDAHYECYPNGRGEDALAAKGALYAKVHVGTSHQEQRIVGYITCTHLHAIEGDASVRCEQLDLLLEWGAEFRRSTSQLGEAEKGLEDQVAFDVILGDLNFDNCSSEDKLEQQHSVFTQYRDPCRLGPGEDKPWALGTLLDTSGLYDEEVSSPESLQKVMENEESRKEYLVFPASKNQCPNQKGRKIPLKGNGRRIDYILYREEVAQADWKVDIEEFSFITQLAGLTDHLSVALRLAVSTGEEES
ncbi:sphingomyelin phosphodiesterase 3 [Electrophorus electricus]|uniref:Sphingomyelin phosphodiesterase 3 n=1 Tax=Electrophorus electricus TaxID=8005 RepID=A0A4W4FXF7_ELEEL|nr:sphingomyelin phosphodiesterase 3 [Electrophorus electricus]XP_035388216.1 sphingomyelin phosphodiesterase 3 [Electrophorus electricus]XP_035388217.1 sphingomyelin phosphodiesterase 3 [Electrophorus electricus]XP_035388218.1 sphingomyelin phosphodiesterase 3 [Electrophorus electricus]